MPLNYEQNNRLKALAPVLDEHAEWFSHVMRQVAYPDTQQSPHVLSIPGSFRKWIAGAQDDENIPDETIEGLSSLYRDLEDHARRLLDGAVKGTRPDVKGFDHFVMLYEEFISHIRRLERDVALSDSGFDVLTGLRSRQVMAHDIERELQRRARRGWPFCLALARIDYHDRIHSGLNREDYNSLLRETAALIKQCIRSFDDAYYLHNGEFLMSLKQTEISGGTAGLTRLRRLLEKESPSYKIDGKEYRLSMSSCVAEPQPGDRLDELMAHMRADLSKYSTDGEVVVEYVEVSPVQRFLADMDGPSGD